jgi:hypothetical protein
MENSNDEFLHTMKDGTKFLLKELNDAHLQNIIEMIERKANDGLLFRDVYDDCVSYFSYGEDVLNFMKYEKYIEEQNRRKNAGD